MKRILALFLSCVVLLAAAWPAGASGTPDSMSGARSVTLNQAVEDALQNASDERNYTFTLNEPGSLTLGFQFVPGGDYIVELFTADTGGDLTQLQYTNFYYDRETVSGTIALQANRLRLPPGTYYVRVRAYGSSGYRADSYILSLMFEAEPGNSYEREWNDPARNAMRLDPNQSVNGNLASSDDVDFYCFSLLHAGCLQTRFGFVPGGDYNFRLYTLNSEGGLDLIRYFNIYFSGESQSALIQRELDRQRLPAGEYYIEISAYSSSGFVNDDYILSLSFTQEAAPAYEAEFNDTGINANPISLNEMVTGNLGASEDEDYFRFTLDRTGNIALQFAFAPDGDYNVTVYSVNADGSLEWLHTFNFYVSQESMLPQVTQTSDSLNLEAGMYFVQISAYSGSGYSNADYSLTVVSG